MSPDLSPAPLPGSSRAHPALRTRLANAATSCLLVAATGLLLGCFGHAVPSAPTAALDQPVPTALVADDGTPAPVPVPGGKSAVFHFWSPLCEPCKATIPAVLKKREEMRQKGAELVLVAELPEGQTANDAKATLALWGIDERFVVDTNGAFLHKVGARDLPAFAIVDSTGILRWVAPDGVTISNLLAAIP